MINLIRANTKAEHLRIVVLSSLFVDYSIKIATPLCQKSKVLLLADNRTLNRDVSPLEIKEFISKGGQIKTFRQSRVWNRWWSVIRISVLMVCFRPHVIVAHEHIHPHLTWIMRAGTLFSRLLLIVHDPNPHIGRDQTFMNANRQESEAQRRMASAFIVHGQYCADTLKLQQHTQTSKPIYPIVLGANFSPDKPTQFIKRRRLLMFGRMEMYKGLELLLEACQQLNARGVAFDLRLAGSGPELDRLKDRFLALGYCTIESRFISREEALDEFANADFLVAPYIEATQSGVVAIAFAAGCPVVATKVGGLVDFINHDVNGLLVPPNDPTLFADALARMLEESGLAERLAQGARISADNEHSWNSISNSLWQAIQKTVK